MILYKEWSLYMISLQTAKISGLALEIGQKQKE
jgi:hypothetical protein